MKSIRETYATFRRARDLERSGRRPYPAIDWLGRVIYGFCGMALLRLLLPTKITANQLSAAGALIGVAGGVFLTIPGRMYSWIGVVLLQLFIIVDFTDGSLSRARNSSSTQGLVFDNLLGELVSILLFVAVGLHDMFAFHNVVYLYLGVAAALAAIMLRHVYNVKIVCVLIREKDRVQEVLANRSQWSHPAGPQNRSSKKTWKQRIAQSVGLLLLSRHFINLLCLAYIFKITYLFTIFYGILFPLIFLRVLYVELGSGFEEVYRWIASSKD